MKPETTKRLEAILDNRQKQKQAAITQATERQKAEAKNLADFLAKKEETIKPALQEVVELYKARGVHLRIAEQDEHPNDRGGTVSPSIGLDMTEAYPSRGLPSAEFKLSFEKRNRSLSLYTSTGSNAGPAGNVSLDAITADWIQEAFVKYQSGS